jgi:hypothetical protein
MASARYMRYGRCVRGALAEGDYPGGDDVDRMGLGHSARMVKV